MPLRTMTPAEQEALCQLDAAEQAVNEALAAREAAHQRLEAITRRERRRAQAKASPRHLRLIVGTKRSSTSAVTRQGGHT
jgi:hypothetical protein